jgi:peroxiredoxin
MKWRGISETEPEVLRSTLKEELEQRRLLMRRFVPADSQAINDRAIEELRQQGLAGKALKVGDRAPDFTLPDVNGKLVSSAELIINGPLVVTFIRGRWCPFCCGTVETWQAMLPQVKEAGATLIVISPMTTKQADFMRDQHKLMFPILSDEGNQVASRFGVSYVVPKYQQESFLSAFINLPFIDNDESWTLPLPATFVIGQDGVVAYAWANEDYTLRAEPAEVLQTFLQQH